MKCPKLLQSLLFLAVLFPALSHAQDVTCPAPPSHKFDDPPSTPVHCLAPIGIKEEDETKYQLTKAFLTQSQTAAGVTRAWVSRHNAAANGDDVGYAIAVDDSGYVYVTGYSYNAAGNRDYLTIKYTNDGVKKWVARFNGPANQDDVAYALAVDNDGNVYVGGYSVNVNLNRDFVTIKYDRNGVRQWVARYNGPGNCHDGIFTLRLDHDNNVCVAGYSYGNNTEYDWAVLKYNSAGVKQWLYRYDGPSHLKDCAYEMAIDQANNVHVAGYSAGGDGDFDYFTLQLNGAGVPQWSARYGATADSTDIANDIALDEDGNVYLTGFSLNKAGNFDYLTIKYDGAGILQWTARYNGAAAGYDRAMDVTVDANGNVLVTGRSWGGITNSDDWATVKYDNAGVKQWLARYNGPGDGPDIAYRVWVDATGNVYVDGYSYRGDFACFDYTAIGYDGAGAKQWLVRYDGPAHLSDFSYDMALDTAGCLYVTGGSGSTINGMDLVTIKYKNASSAAAANAPELDKEEGSSRQSSSAVPEFFGLAQNYPNPFNPVTKIGFALTRETRGKVKLAVYNVRGELVQTLIDAEMAAGYYDLAFEASRLPSGNYFYRLNAGAYSAVRKMILQK